MKKKKNRGTNWGLLVFVLVFMIAAVFGYSFIQFYQERNTSTHYRPEGGKTPPAVTPSQPGRSNDVSDDETDPDLYQTQLAELERTIGRLHSSVGSALEQLGLQLSGRSAQVQELEIHDDLTLSWEQVKGTIAIPSGKYSMSHVADVLGTAAQNARGELIRAEQDGEGQVISLGLTYNGQEIVTHRLKVAGEPEEQTPPKVQPSPVKPGAKAKLAFIIDDLGYEWPEFDRMMTIPRPMTFAVIPHLPFSTKQAQRVWARGYDLILHQPMEALAKNNNPGQGAIYTNMTEDEIVKTLSNNLASLPQGLIGANNHMGSKATSDPRVMEIVLRFFRDRGMFFIDSHTSPDTVVAEVARDVGETFGENRIFLDNVDELEPIKEQIRKAAKIALRDGYAITIGHVRKYTAKAILEMIDEIERMGIEIVPARDLLERY